MPVSKSRGKRTDGSILTAFRLSPDAKAELNVVRRVLELSTDVAAVQFAIRRAYNQLLELAPMTARDAANLESLKAEELDRQAQRAGAEEEAAGGEERGARDASPGAGGARKAPRSPARRKGR